VINPEGGFCADCGEHFEDGFPPEKDKPEEDPATLEEIMASLKRIEKAIALVAEEALTDVPLPEDSPKE
jgi:hypothetical protein